MSTAATLAGRIKAVTTLDPDHRGVEYKSGWYTWGGISQVMEKIETLLSSSGFGEGVAVGMVLRNRPAHFAAMLQVLSSKRCMVTINPMSGTGKLIQDITLLKTPVIVADADEWRVPEFADAVRSVGAIGISLGGETLLDVAFADGFSQLGEGAHHAPMPGIGIQMLTSGTTGPSKRIKLDYKDLEHALLGALFYEAGDPNKVELKSSVVICLSPFVHIGGVWTAVSAVVSGRSLCLLEKFTVADWHQAVKAHKPKVAAMPPTAIRMVLDAKLPKDDLNSILAIRSATAPLDPALADAVLEAYGIPVLDSYGATEFAGGVAGWTMADYKEFGSGKRGSVGRAQPGCELRIVDAGHFDVLPANNVGLLEVRAKHVNNGEWLRTTDLAELDGDGFLYIRGRADDAIIRGGFKIIPKELVDLLKKHPAVLDASVVGLPDERLGSVPVAAVELVADAGTVSEEALLAYMRSQLTGYQTPVAMKIVDALPRTPSMKVAQPEVKKLFEGVPL